MIINCSLCNMDTGGNHEPECPLSKESLESVRRGLKQTATIYRGSFAKYVIPDEAADTVTDTATKYLKGEGE